MTFEEAKEALLFHSGAHPDIDDARWQCGFLGSLRPYRGLKEENFHNVMEAIIALAPYLQEEPCVDKKVMDSLWSLCFWARYWAILPDGMLRRNNLITNEDVVRLEEWLTAISWAIAMLLDGQDLEDALTEYRGIQVKNPF